MFLRVFKFTIKTKKIEENCPRWTFSSETAAKNSFEVLPMYSILLVIKYDSAIPITLSAIDMKFDVTRLETGIIMSIYNNVIIAGK
ncbi:hypothetical protein [Streptococcus sciuri]|uniref:Uncharacterized protein n=1 Tax=Streptococcus sciuri TaxID=2973939 RepID=A0ABT2F602_9STRE|nr:hypothetical protein [Streptococcus sciuri]MCS4487906.1 hypothetical protein [Streptococcus sciuri]